MDDLIIHKQTKGYWDGLHEVEKILNQLRRLETEQETVTILSVEVALERVKRKMEVSDGER